MSTFQISSPRIQDGVWTALIAPRDPDTSSDEPHLKAFHNGLPVETLTLSGTSPEWTASFEIPKHLISSGAHGVVIVETNTNAIVGHFTLLVGPSEADDPLSEIASLRAELDLLKQVVRAQARQS